MLKFVKNVENVWKVEIIKTFKILGNPKIVKIHVNYCKLNDLEIIITFKILGNPKIVKIHVNYCKLNDPQNIIKFWDGGRFNTYDTEHLL